jgi:hypothetical protein
MLVTEADREPIRVGSDPYGREGLGVAHANT